MIIDCGKNMILLINLQKKEAKLLDITNIFNGKEINK